MRKPGQDGDQRKDVMGDGYSYLDRVSVQRRAVCAMLQWSKVRWTQGWSGWVRQLTAAILGQWISRSSRDGPLIHLAGAEFLVLRVSRFPLRLFAVRQ